MATEKQIAANRRNALKSTGPRTAEGKARSRLNAVTHGLRARIPVLDCKHHHETAQAYAQLHTTLVKRFRPVGTEERNLVASIADCTWRLERARATAEALIRPERTVADSPSSRAKRSNLSADKAAVDRLAALERYYMRLTRRLENALHHAALLRTNPTP